MYTRGKEGKGMEEYGKIIAKNLKAIMYEHKKTQADVAKDLGINKATVSSWMNGTRIPRMPKIDLLCHYFNVSRADIMEPHTSAPVAYKTTMIPKLSAVSAGSGVLAQENVEGYVDIPEAMAKTGNFFALTVKGDSMEPDLHDKDVVIVKQQPDAETGDLVIAKVNGDEGFCKRLKKYADGIALVSVNPSYEPMYFSDKQVKEEPVVVVGKVVEVRRKL